MTRWLALLLACLAWATPALAQTPVASRAETLLQALKTGKADPADFSPTFLAQVPVAQVDAIAAQLKAQNGAVLGITSIKPRDATEADVVIEYEQATVNAQFALEPSAPNRFIGLFIMGAVRKGDSFDKILSELKALPGQTALRIERLGAGPPLIEHNSTAAMAMASSFKLFVLDALVTEIAAKQRKWNDVIPLGAPSLPSGVTQDWPRGTPMTLQALATQMISISDNTATDTLMTTLGLPLIDKARARFGNTPGSLPVLTTLGAFSLKMPAREALRKRWIAGGLSDRRQVINELEPTVEALDKRALGGGPAHIATVEWPATTVEMSAVLAALRRSPEAMAILGVNTALAPDIRARFATIGYKGGSETGVIAMNWLLKSKSGDWFTVSGAWNDPKAAVADGVFAALMMRAVTLVGQ
jgi:Beta-lactamase enzyme family